MVSFNVIVTLFHLFYPLVGNVQNSWIYVDKIIRELLPDIGIISFRPIFEINLGFENLRKVQNYPIPLSNMADEGTEATNYVN